MTKEKYLLGWLVLTLYKVHQAKRYRIADMIRDKLAEIGVILQDTPAGTRWYYKK